MKIVLFSLTLGFVSVVAQAEVLDNHDWDKVSVDQPCKEIAVKNYGRRVKIVDTGTYYWEKVAEYHVNGSPVLTLFEVSNGTYVFPGTEGERARVNRKAIYRNGTWERVTPTLDGDLAVYRKPTLEKIVREHNISGCI